MSSAGFVGRAANLGRQVVTPRALSPKNRKYTYTSFPSPGSWVAAAGYGNPAGTTGATNHGYLPSDIGGPLHLEYFIKGAGQTLLAPTLADAGLLVSLDLVNDEGVDYVFGGHSLRGRHAYTVGTHDFFAKLSFSVADVSGTDECLFGFRKVEAFGTAHTTYTDYALIGMVAAVGDIVIKTNLNDGTPVTVDTTQNFADTNTKTFQVSVNKAGVAKFEIDNADPTVGVNGFTFDAGDVLVPTFIFLHAATTPGAVHFTAFEAGRATTDERG